MSFPQYRFASFGWANTQNAVTPTIIPSGIQNINIISHPTPPEQIAKPGVFIDGSVRGYPGALTFDFVLELFVSQFNLSTAGIANALSMYQWVQNDPKFIQSTDAWWVSLFGTGWIGVVLMGKADEGKEYGYLHWKLNLRTAQPLRLGLS